MGWHIRKARFLLRQYHSNYSHNLKFNTKHRLLLSEMEHVGNRTTSLSAEALHLYSAFVKTKNELSILTYLGSEFSLHKNPSSK
jgi:hypothetical protein